MKDKWEKLTDIFLEILALYQNVLKLGYQKRDVLVENSVEELMEITKQEEILLLQLAKLDRIRQSVIQDLSQMYGLGDKKYTMYQLSEMTDQEMIYNLKEVDQELSKVVLELSQLNEVNKQLVDQGLLIANYSLNLLAQSTVGPTYHPNEKASSAPSARTLFDSKA